MKTSILHFIFIITSTVIFAQTQSLKNETILNGYEKKIEGQDFNYQSSIPVAKECLLVRATNGKSSMEWKTVPVPSNTNGEYITFAWLAGLGSSPGSAKFNVEVNGIQKFSFWTDDNNQWEDKAEDGSMPAHRLVPQGMSMPDNLGSVIRVNEEKLTQSVRV